MMKHSQIRNRVFQALKLHISQTVSWFEGKPGQLTALQLPAVAVYFSDLAPDDHELDGSYWQGNLHVEIYLEATAPDSMRDNFVETSLSALSQLSALSEITESVILQRYDYRQDEDAYLWRSADLSFSIIYQL